MAQPPRLASPRPDLASTPPGFGPGALVVTAIIIAALYLSRDVLVPVVFAILLSFVLALPIGALQKLGMGRKLPVAIVVLVAFLMIGAIATIVTNQASDIVAELPKYQSTIREKLISIRGSTGGGPLDRLIDMGENLSKEVSKEAAPTLPADQQPQRPIQVEVTEPKPGPWKMLSSVVAPALKPLGTAGLVIVFTVFMLLQRTDLRNRAIRLAGSHDLQRTTSAMNDAATRLSKFFLVQVLLNAGFGLVVGLGLWLLGVPSPMLWGILAAISKFIPYFGVVIAAGGPLLLAAAIDPTWTTFFLTAAFFAVSEFLLGQVIEPLVYGHSTGLSPVAVILSVTFWTWLWGPVGLILATPLTVCLVVLGRHVDRLQFLDVMLGDRPPLTISENFYQRALAGDSAEIVDQAEDFLAQHRLPTFYDEVVVPGLRLAQADLARNALSEARLDRVASTMHHLIEELDDHDDGPDTSPDLSLPILETNRLADGDEHLAAALLQADRRSSQLPRIEAERHGAPGGHAPVLCIANRTELDRIAADMLAQILRKHGLGAQVESAHALTPAGVGRLERPETRLVCLSSLDASTPARLRHAIRRIRRRIPGAKVLIACWGLDPAELASLHEATEADASVGRLTEAALSCLEEASAAAPDARPPEPLATLPRRAS